MEDFDRQYRAVQSRDPRFDGWFFTAVRSTGIYCRPSCPARTPMARHVRFYPTAAAAQHAGYRACMRCRPDAAPGSPEWLGRADVAARAVKLVFDGVVDRDGVAGLARRLGYGERQLHRVLVAELGTGALALARAQRAQTARLLLETTDLPITQVAFGAGFASVRQFNDTVHAVFARTPSQLRATSRHRGGDRPSPQSTGTPGRTDALQSVTVRLAYRSPFATEALFSFLGQRAVAGVEHYDGSTYRRTLRLTHGAGTVALSTERGHVRAEFNLSDLRDLTAAIARCRHLCNLDADPVAIDEVLGSDAVLAPLVANQPGLRVPGSVDGFEIAVRAVVGQQVSVQGARTVLGGLVEAAGSTISGHHDALTHVFPSPQAIADLAGRRPEVFPMPAGRRRALLELAKALALGHFSIDPGADPVDLFAQLHDMPGIGPWTTQYITMRALGDPDAFLDSDLGARRAAIALGIPDQPAALRAVAENWRPWRAYAQMHLWSMASPPHTSTNRGKDAA